MRHGLISDTGYHLTGTGSQRPCSAVCSFRGWTMGGGMGAWRAARVPGGIEEMLRRYKVTTVYEPVW